jgi:hypothetical protein
VEFVSFDIEHKETLNKGSGNEGSTGDASLPLMAQRYPKLR